MGFLCKIFGHFYKEYSRFGLYPYKRVCRLCGKEQAYEGEWVDKTFKESLLEEVLRQLEKPNSNAAQIYAEIEEKGGTVCTDGFGYFLLVGAVATEEDYYYIGIDINDNIRYISCVGGVKQSTDRSMNIPFETHIKFFGLDLKEKVEKSIKDGDHVLITRLIFQRDEAVKL
jgi:hypothetical protein